MRLMQLLAHLARGIDAHPDEDLTLVFQVAASGLLEDDLEPLAHFARTGTFLEAQTIDDDALALPSEPGASGTQVINTDEVRKLLLYRELAYLLWLLREGHVSITRAAYRAPKDMRTGPTKILSYGGSFSGGNTFAGDGLCIHARGVAGKTELMFLEKSAKTPATATT